MEEPILVGLALVAAADGSELRPVHHADADGSPADGPHEAVAVAHCTWGSQWEVSKLKEHVDFHAFRKYGVWLVVGAILGALLQISPTGTFIGHHRIFSSCCVAHHGRSGRATDPGAMTGSEASDLNHGRIVRPQGARAMFLLRSPDKMAYA